MVTVRSCLAVDVPAADRLLRATASFATAMSPDEYPESFLAQTALEDLLVAVVDDEVVGVVKLARPAKELAQAHVLTIAGLAVDEARRGGGVGRALVMAAVDRARDVGARKVTLHVFGSNDPARLLYEGLGFTVEGVLREEFLIDGVYVDDVLMARRLT